MWEQAEKFLLKDKYIAPLVKKWGSCSIKKSPKLKYFVDLLEAITNQQLSGKAASTIFGRVKNLCKGGISPEAIIKLSEAKLRGAGLSYAKIKYVKDLAVKVKGQKLKIKSLDELPDEEVKKELVAVKGIGPWTTDMFLMFSLGRPDIFPAEDLGIKNGFEKVTGKKFDKEKSAKFALKYWAPYRTIASWYLWRSLENE
jgi:3-methyladenine DNA glycosylase/8-oxoguanine DNA glycosylase